MISNSLVFMGGYMSIIRKHIFYMIIVLAFILAGCSHSAKELNIEYKIKSGQDIDFYITTDIHYLSKTLTDNGEAFKKYVLSGDGKQLQYINEILDAFTYHVSNEKPDVLIISGDLTNNGEKLSHVELAKKLEIIEKRGIPVYVIPGNHDISNPWARSFKGDKQYVAESINSRGFSQIYKEFGYAEAISRDKNTLSYLAAPSEDIWLLMLDTNTYKRNFRIGSPQADGKISQETFKWIKKCSALAREKGANIITVMHHSMLNHSPVIQEGYTLNDNEEAIEKFKENDLKLVLSGHIHIQDISSYKKDEDIIYDAATGSLAVYPHQYGILRYSAVDISFNYSTSKVEVEGWSRNTGIIDKNLNNFRDYAEEFFGKLAYDMAYKQLIMEESYSEEEMKAMSDIMRILNLRYFSGTENLNLEDVIDSEGYKLWSDAPESFIKSYISSIFIDIDTDDNNLIIPIQSK